MSDSDDDEEIEAMFAEDSQSEHENGPGRSQKGDFTARGA